MSSLLTPNFNPRKKAKSTSVLYDKGSKKYATSIAEVKRIFGPDAIKKANAIVKEFATDDTKSLLLTDMGNSIPTIHRVLEFGDKVDRTRNQALKEAEEEIGFYENSPTMLKGRFQKVENDIRDDFQKMLSGDAKQEHIDEHGPLSML